LNLAGDVIEFERITGVHGREGWSLPPPPVKQFPVSSDTIPVIRFGVLCDLQEALGKTQGRSAADFAHGYCDAFGSSSWVA
jgi:hypothetical protein